ncbi:hypothetical protein FOA52_013353 [Chlamydomonas sp. UWO 241]|nr:hypothetical protein FOA52_013353 [Chlamydomonas sp. UWO 241]
MSGAAPPWDGQSEFVKVLDKVLESRCSASRLARLGELAVHDERNSYKVAVKLMERASKKAGGDATANLHLLYVLSEILRQSRAMHGSNGKYAERTTPLISTLLENLADSGNQDKARRLLMTWRKEKVYGSERLSAFASSLKIDESALKPSRGSGGGGGAAAFSGGGGGGGAAAAAERGDEFDLEMDLEPDLSPTAGAVGSWHADRLLATQAQASTGHDHHGHGHSYSAAAAAPGRGRTPEAHSAYGGSTGNGYCSGGAPAPAPPPPPPPPPPPAHTPASSDRPAVQQQQQRRALRWPTRPTPDASPAPSGAPTPTPGDGGGGAGMTAASAGGGSGNGGGQYDPFDDEPGAGDGGGMSGDASGMAMGGLPPLPRPSGRASPPPPPPPSWQTGSVPGPRVPAPASAPPPLPQMLPWQMGGGQMQMGGGQMPMMGGGQMPMMGGHMPMMGGQQFYHGMMPFPPAGMAADVSPAGYDMHHNHHNHQPPPMPPSWHHYSGSGGAPEPGRPTFTAANKTYLKPRERIELARRLRAAGSNAASPPLRVFRHALDDLRLFKALEASGLLASGRVAIADSLSRADVVIATRRKRTGRDVVLGPVEAAARNAGLPYFELPTVSAPRLLEALGPMLGLDPHQLGVGQLRGRFAAGGGDLDSEVRLPREAVAAPLPQEQQQPQQQQQQQQAAREEQVAVRAAGKGAAATSGRAALGAAAAAAAASRWGARAADAGATAAAASMAAAAAPPAATGAAAGAGARTRTAPQRAAAVEAVAAAAAAAAGPSMADRLQQSIADAPLDLLTGVDDRETRRYLLPRNPSDHLGPRFVFKRPGVATGGAARRRRLRQQRAEEKAPW